MDQQDTQDTLPLVKQIAQIIYERKGFNILAIDVKGLSSITDYFLIAEGNVERHVRAIGQEIVRQLKQEGIKPIRVEGERVGDWMVVDYGDIMIHLFKPGLRQHYHLEHLWQARESRRTSTRVGRT